MLAAQSQDYHVRVLRSGQGFFKAAFVRSGDGITIGIRDLRVRQAYPQLFQQAAAARLLASQDRVEFLALVGLDIRAGNGSDWPPVRHHTADARDGVSHGQGGFHHAQVGIAAEKLARAVGMGADERDFFDRFFEWQRPVIFQQHQRFPGRAQGNFPILRIGEGFFQFLTLQGEGMLKQAHAKLGLQHPQHRPVENGDIRLAALEHSFEFLVPSGRGGQLHVHPGLHTAVTRLGKALADVMHAVGIADSAIIADAESVKAHFFPQQTGQQFLGGRNRFAVQGVVAGHDPFETRVDRRLEGLGVDLPQEPWRRVAVGAVDAALGVVEGQEMLGHALRPSACRLGVLDAAGIGYAEGGGQGRVLAVALALTPHAGVAGHVQHRSKDLRDAAGGLLTADSPRDFRFQFRVPARAPGDPGRKAGGILQKRAAQPLHVEDGRDLVGRVCHDDLLHPPLPCGAFLQRITPPHLQGADLADSEGHLGGDPVKILRVLPEGEHAAQLRHFLVQRQFS